MATTVDPPSVTASGRARHRSDEGESKGSSRVGPVLLTTVTWILGIGFFFPVLWMVLTEIGRAHV